MVTRKADPSLAWTEDQAAARLLARDRMALLIGFLLDQQVPMEWAFGAPELLRQRLGGTLDPGKIAAMDPAELLAAFLARPPLHRYPAAMARRTQALARRLVDEYGGDPAQIWESASDAAEVSRRMAKLPGLSANKARVIIGTLAKRLAVETPGWEKLAPDWFSMADVDSKAALQKYRDIKRAAKASGDWPPGKARGPAARKPAAAKPTARKPAPRKPAAKKAAAKKG